MADDSGQKTEAPTPRRRKESRNKGQIARSQDLNGVVILLGGLIALKIIGGRMWLEMQALVRTYLSDDPVRGVGSEAMGEWVMQAAGSLARLVTPFLVAMFVFALLIALVQTGWLLTAEPLRPSLSKLNPINGIKRMFSARSLVQLGMNVGKLLAMLTVVYITVGQKLEEIMGVILLHEALLWSRGAGLVFTVAIRILVLMLVLALLDYVYQRYRHEKDLKMTREEIKEEMRRMEGDPVMKRRRRQVQQQLALQRVQTVVPQADAVVTNPTEFAVAIKYELATMSAPRVVAKGQDFMAAQIRKIAMEYGVPIVERPPLARALYRAVEVGREIPAELYQAVAEILAYIYELTGRKPAVTT